MMNTVHFGGAPLETRYHIEKGHIAGAQGHECALTFVKSGRKLHKACDQVVDLKGIEPSNLTDANRALSQLSYKPIFN